MRLAAQDDSMNNKVLKLNKYNFYSFIEDVEDRAIRKGRSSEQEKIAFLREGLTEKIKNKLRTAMRIQLEDEEKEK